MCLAPPPHTHTHPQWRGRPPKKNNSTPFYCFLLTWESQYPNNIKISNQTTFQYRLWIKIPPRLSDKYYLYSCHGRIQLQGISIFSTDIIGRVDFSRYMYYFSKLEWPTTDSYLASIFWYIFLCFE